MKDWQLEVILLLNPVSKGVGRGLELSVVVAALPLDVLVGASVDVVLTVEVGELLSVLRRRRSSVVSKSQLFGSGGGL